MFDILIIGAGPAGGSAALFSAKAGKKTVVIDNDKSMTKRAWMENHYGILEISGPDMIETGKKQAQKFGAEIITSSVEKIEKALNALNLLSDKNLTFCKFAGNVKCNFCKKVIIENFFSVGYDDTGNEILTDGEEYVCIAPIPQCPKN